MGAAPSRALRPHSLLPDGLRFTRIHSKVRGAAGAAPGVGEPGRDRGRPNSGGVGWRVPESSGRGGSLQRSPGVPAPRGRS